MLFKHRLDKIWVDIGRQFYSRSRKSWLQKNNKEMLFSDAAERLVKG